MPVASYSSLGFGFFFGRSKSDDAANVKKYMDNFARIVQSEAVS